VVKREKLYFDLKNLVYNFHDLARKVEALENKESAYIALEIRRSADLLHNIEKCLSKSNDIHGWTK
jgi:hypothetical protein